MSDEWKKQEANDMWQPEAVGDTLIGEVTAVEEGLFGLQHTLKREDGSSIKTPSHKVLQNRLVECKVGDTVKIAFTGEEPPSVKGNNPTKMYDVFKKGGN